MEHRAGPRPALLLVERGGSLIADGASKPSGRDSRFRHARFAIGKQGGADAGASPMRRDVELVELVATYHAESDRRVDFAGDANTRQRCEKPLLEALQRPVSSQFGRQDFGMSILPAVVPDLRQRLDLRRAGGPHQGRDGQIADHRRYHFRWRQAPDSR